MTEQGRFLNRFAEMRKSGLVDIKFFVDRSRQGLTVEEFFKSANMFADAVESGNCKRHAEWPFVQKQVSVDALLQ